jgi:hypothetical protein
MPPIICAAASLPCTASCSRSTSVHGSGRHRLPPLPSATRHRASRLQLRPASCRRCRSHSRHRQCHAQTHAGWQTPVAVGFMFSLGHSTVVVLGSAAIAGAALVLQHRFDAIKNLASIVGTLVSVLFLFAIAIINLVVLRSIYRTFVRVRRGEPYVEEDLNLLLSGRGFLSRIFRPVFHMIDRSWHMYPLGVLFGLGFDTATEIGVLGISAAEAAKGLSFGAILVFPVLFAAGMSLIDTTDNILMLGALWIGFCKTHSQALLQHHHHLCLRSRRPGCRRHRGPRTIRRTLSSRRMVLGYRSPAQR